MGTWLRSEFETPTIQLRDQLKEGGSDPHVQDYLTITARAVLRRLMTGKEPPKGMRMQTDLNYTTTKVAAIFFYSLFFLFF